MTLRLARERPIVRLSQEQVMIDIRDADIDSAFLKAEGHCMRGKDSGLFTGYVRRV